MIYLYLFSLVVGGGLLGVSILLGGHADTDASGPEVHMDSPPQSVGHDGGPYAGVESYLYWLVSLRFWTFFVAFFGLTGLVFDGLGLAPRWVTLIVAIGMGAVSGGAAMAAIRAVSKGETNSAITTRDYVGKTGRVLVGFGPGAVGKVRIEVKGSVVDVLAIPEDTRSYAAEDEVIVVEMEGLHAKVSHVRPSDPPSAA